jgi:hypothetical protein
MNPMTALRRCGKSGTFAGITSCWSQSVNGVTIHGYSCRSRLIAAAEYHPCSPKNDCRSTLYARWV